MLPDDIDAPSTEPPVEPPTEPPAESPAASPAEAMVEDAPVQSAEAEATGAAVAEPTAEPEPAPDEGPRRRARRERAERRAAQARAEAIERARREAKRRALADPADESEAIPRGAIRSLKAMLVVALGVVVVVGVGLVLYFTPVMSARNVEVLGINMVSQDEVLDAAKVKLGTPLLQIDTGQVADRVATIRRVASVRVQRQYPSALRIAVTERIPVVVQDFPDGPHLFDRDGVDFATAPPPPLLPYLEADNPGPTDPATRAALQVMIALNPEVVAQVSRVAAPSVDSVTLTLTDGRVVVWGNTERTAEKAQKLAALLTQPGRTYDVSSPDLPTVK